MEMETGRGLGSLGSEEMELWVEGVGPGGGNIDDRISFAISHMIQQRGRRVNVERSICSSYRLYTIRTLGESRESRGEKLGNVCRRMPEASLTQDGIFRIVLRAGECLPPQQQRQHY